MDTSAEKVVMDPKAALHRYLIDPGISRFTVRAFATGMLSALGHSPTIAIRDFEGEAHYSEDSLAGADLIIRIKAESLSVQDQISDKDRREMERQMKEDVLEVSRFPEIVYRCSSISGTQLGGAFPVTLQGELTLHGITRQLPMNARVMTMGPMLKASGEFEIRQSDYHMKPVSAVGGGLKLKDELKFSFDLAARKQQS